MKIKNIQYQLNSIDLKNSKYKNILENEKIVSFLKNHIPHEKLEFEIYDVYASFVNAIRRVAETELNVYYLSVDKSNIDTNDRYLLKDFIINQIESIPINQDLVLNTKFNLNIKNAIECPIKITTNDLKISNDTTINYFNKNIELFKLHSNNYLKIDNIFIKKCLVEDISSNKLCVSSYDLINFDYSNQSLEFLNADYKFFIHSFGLMKTKRIINLVVDTIIFRLNSIKENINNNIQDVSFNITKKNNIHTFYIKNENHTIKNLIYDYGMNNFKDLNLFFEPVHPQIKELIIVIDNINAKKILINIIEIIIKEFQTFNNNFK